MPLKKKKLLTKTAPLQAPDAPDGEPARETPRATAASVVTEAWRASRARRGLAALALSAIGLALVGWLLFFTLGKLADFKLGLDFQSWLPAIAQSAGFNAKRTNILVAGVGGSSNDAPWLTDSIMLVSVDPDAGTAAFLSVPRDLYVVTKDFGGGKINELYARGRARWGQEKAAQILADKVTEITGEPVDKYVIADFDGFVKMVDLLGGVDVDVPESLVDTQYPDDNWGYATFSIAAGAQHLDGATALKYVRSRHSTSDFDRSRRQQIVLDAVKSRMISRDVFTSPGKIRALLATLSSHMWTDLNIADLVGLGAAVAGRKDFRVVGANLNDGCWQNGPCNAGALLYAPTREAFGGESILLPTASDGSDPAQYGQIRKFAYVVYHMTHVLTDARPIRVFNGTKMPGLAGRAATQLRRYGFNVPQDGGVASLSGATVAKTVVKFRPDLAGDPTLDALGMWFFSAQEPFGTGADAPQGTGSQVEILLGGDAETFLE